MKKTVSICESQPITAEGLRCLVHAADDLAFGQAVGNLNQASELLRRQKPDLLIVDKTFGIQSMLEWLDAQRDAACGIIVWGVSVTEAEALRFLQSGARGVLRKSAALPVILACLRTVAAGKSWMEDSVFRDAARSERYSRTDLTAREQQVLELVEQGFKNKEIASELGIRPGTVKIHLKHIFEKTGVRGRYGLALSGLKERGVVALTA